MNVYFSHFRFFATFLPLLVYDLRFLPWWVISSWRRKADNQTSSYLIYTYSFSFFSFSSFWTFSLISTTSGNNCSWIHTLDLKKHEKRRENKMGIKGKYFLCYSSVLYNLSSYCYKFVVCELSVEFVLLRRTEEGD